MRKFFPARFLRDDDGAVTVEWVVLTSAIILLAIGVLPPIYSAVNTVATAIVEDIEAGVEEDDDDNG